MSIKWAYDDGLNVVDTRVQYFIDEVRSKEHKLTPDEVKDLTDLLEIYVGDKVDPGDEDDEDLEEEE